MAAAKAQVPDAALVAAARAGDRAAMSALAERHHGAVLRFATRACGDPERARDAAQDTLLTMLSHLGQLQDVGRAAAVAARDRAPAVRAGAPARARAGRARRRAPAGRGAQRRRGP
jgi:DNA-directed RNA polymerase specialized sigma24 family protein